MVPLGLSTVPEPTFCQYPVYILLTGMAGSAATGYNFFILVPNLSCFSIVAPSNIALRYPNSLLVSKLDKSNDTKFVIPANIKENPITFEVLKFERSKSVMLATFLNMAVMLVTWLVSKVETSNEETPIPSNILSIFFTRLVSKLDKLMFVKD